MRSPEFDAKGRTIPTFYGEADRRALVLFWGLPNAHPEPGCDLFGPLGTFGAHCRLLFVDDDRDGAPVAFWRSNGPWPRHHYWRPWGRP